VTLKRPVIGWLLDTDHRKALLARIEPAYARTIAHHVTLKPDAEAGEAAPEARTAAVVGVADDGAGVQALVVELNGTTARPDGGTYHITWSLAPGRDARESNDVIAAKGWTPYERIAIHLKPARF
jgi:hypothetical protein